MGSDYRGKVVTDPRECISRPQTGIAGSGLKHQLKINPEAAFHGWLFLVPSARVDSVFIPGVNNKNKEKRETTS